MPNFKFQPRRPHKKSRLGCLECKRRKIKCDELKPSCSRCELLERTCSYPPTIRWASSQLDLPTPPASISTTSPDVDATLRSPPQPEYIPTRETSAPAAVGPSPVSLLRDETETSHLSEADLYEHYLDHTCRNLSPCPRNQRLRQARFPALALRSKAVFNAMLAVSAACICCDTMSNPSRKGDRSSFVMETLMTGYRLYNLASEQMRQMISEPSAANQEYVLVTGLLLVPFAAASQQINHWLSTRFPVADTQKMLCTTPRDIIILMRGIKATLASISENMQATEQSSESPMSLPELDHAKGGSGSPVASNHPMYALVMSTSTKALSNLKERGFSLDAATICPEDMAACANAIEILISIRNGIFDPGATKPFNPSTAPTAQALKPWLYTYLSWHSSDHTRPLLSFLVQVPQGYLDIVLPLLDQRLVDPLITAPGGTPISQLSKIQALALDIWAHWSALMVLVEEESWYIGSLPVVTLQGMVNRFGQDQVANEMVYGNGSGVDHWWPGSMLKIAHEVQLCRSR